MAVSRDEVELLALNRAFYAAFRARDLSSMDELWARNLPVACIHPGWQPLRGREQVMASWNAIFGASRDADPAGDEASDADDDERGSAPLIRCGEATVHVVGDSAYIVCDELIETDEGEGRLVATNLFVREDGEWRLLHHQAGPVAPRVGLGRGEIGFALADTSDSDGDDDSDGDEQHAADADVDENGDSDGTDLLAGADGAGAERSAQDDLSEIREVLDAKDASDDTLTSRRSARSRRLLN